MENAKLIIFFKPLEIGRVKTRLAQKTGKEKALRYYRAMVEDLLANLSPLKTITVPYVSSFNVADSNAPDSLERIVKIPLREQAEGDLGIKMRSSFQDIFQKKASKAILIGSDIPHIECSMLIDLFHRLDDYPAVIGPSHDGGYYLIGFRRDAFTDMLFNDISWSTQEVFNETISRAESAGLTMYAGKKMQDIDTYDDLENVLKNPEHRKNLPRVLKLFNKFNKIIRKIK